MTELEQTKEELELWKAKYFGLLINLLMDKKTGTYFFDDIDWQHEDAWQVVTERIMGAGIPSGAYKDVSFETVQRVCAELKVADVVQQWHDNMEEACAQNRAFAEGDENERARWN